ncbi:glucose-6-phosphate isomerase [Gulosibacter chungangensis]|uniref:Glucose-6-phosphate isomerase n=1 Tax=Gulosibacter chungangensis TaxID=979746 RepID=A0A7J5BD47_9MICO|nr:glucose-6-phosphate isomerase [Gulosibacter chungangensis]KAB1644120.1 glucose-6-phosphate isomerase [Gulosibacter chungangensis]
MAIKVSTSGSASAAAKRHLDRLVDDKFASRLFAEDATLWGPAAEEESSKRLGWTKAAAVSEPLVAEILALKESLAEKGVDRIVLCGMGGSSLAPEVMTRTAGIDLDVLDSTNPAQVRRALAQDIERTAIVVSSKSGSTVETDSQRRAFVTAFEAAGINPAERIVVVTDPGSPLEQASREAGYSVFLADPSVGGRFSALTAFGLVPAGLAGLDIAAFLAEAQSVSEELAQDSTQNPGLLLGAAIAGGEPIKTFLGVVADGTDIVGFGDWAEQLIAESTGKEGKGLLPVVLDTDAPEIGLPIPDLQIVRLVANAADTPAVGDEINVSGGLAEQMLLWEVAVSVAGEVIGINPFDQPDVESAKAAARELLDATPEPEAPVFEEGNIAVRGTSSVVSGQSDVLGAIEALLAQLPEHGYVAVQAYADRIGQPELAEVREAIAHRARRPVTFGWAPRFLHSTGQFHKGGPRVGAFLQITTNESSDLAISERPFTFGQLIQAQAAGDATVLEGHGMPVLRLELTDPEAGAQQLLEALRNV